MLYSFHTGVTSLFTDVPGCGFRYTTAAEIQCHLDHAVIASAFYPESYIHAEGTSWSIITSPGTYIELKFVDFDVPSKADCFPGRVMVFNSPDASDDFIDKYCNDHNPPPDVVLSSKNALFLEFSPDHRQHGSGFFAEYQARIFTPSIVPAMNSGSDGKCVRVIKTGKSGAIITCLLFSMFC